MNIKNIVEKSPEIKTLLSQLNDEMKQYGIVLINSIIRPLTENEISSDDEHCQWVERCNIITQECWYEWVCYSTDSINLNELLSMKYWGVENGSSTLKRIEYSVMSGYITPASDMHGEVPSNMSSLMINKIETILTSLGITNRDFMVPSGIIAQATGNLQNDVLIWFGQTDESTLSIHYQNKISKKFYTYRNGNIEEEDIKPTEISNYKDGENIPTLITRGIAYVLNDEENKGVKSFYENSKLLDPNFDSVKIELAWDTNNNQLTLLHTPYAGDNPINTGAQVLAYDFGNLCPPGNCCS